MKFTLKGTFSSGSHSEPTAIEQIRYSGQDATKFFTQQFFSSRKSIEFGKLILETKWDFEVLYQTAQIYWMDAETPYYIEDESISSTQSECEEIIKYTHKRLQDSWEKRRETEVNFFPSVPDLTNSEIEIAVEDLRKTLSSEPIQSSIG
ncbi:MAG: hypothetical protein J0L54_17520 [Chitinophagales bacterium]|nr:hypothetical protein [Chitinophagales bacterium]